jgi:NADH-quinone oxidoreductase subunit G
MSEEEGTFTNIRGRVQRYMQVKAAPGFARPGWFVLSDLAAALGGAPIAGGLPSDIFGALAAARPEFAGLSYDSLGAKGGLVAGAMAGASA